MLNAHSARFWSQCQTLNSARIRTPSKRLTMQSNRSRIYHQHRILGIPIEPISLIVPSTADMTCWLNSAKGSTWFDWFDGISAFSTKLSDRIMRGHFEKSDWAASWSCSTHLDSDQKANQACSLHWSRQFPSGLQLRFVLGPKFQTWMVDRWQMKILAPKPDWSKFKNPTLTNQNREHIRL